MTEAIAASATLNMSKSSKSIEPLQVVVPVAPPSRSSKSPRSKGKSLRLLNRTSFEEKAAPRRFIEAKDICSSRLESLLWQDDGDEESHRMIALDNMFRGAKISEAAFPIGLSSVMGKRPYMEDEYRCIPNMERYLNFLKNTDATKSNKTDSEQAMKKALKKVKASEKRRRCSSTLVLDEEGGDLKAAGGENDEQAAVAADVLPPIDNPPSPSGRSKVSKRRSQIGIKKRQSTSGIVIPLANSPEKKVAEKQNATPTTSSNVESLTGGNVLELDNVKAKTSFFGLFDGHGGSNCSRMLATCLAQFIALNKHFDTDLVLAITEAHEDMNKKYEQIASKFNHRDGSTAVTICVREKKLYVSNVGDSRAILVSKGGVKALSEDQKPSNPSEKAIIEAKGGSVQYFKGAARVNGILAVARSFGDIILSGIVTAEPEIAVYEITDLDEFLVLGSDGLFDVMSNDQIYNFIHARIKKTSLSQISKQLSDNAMLLGSQDNITVLVIDIRQTTTCEVNKASMLAQLQSKVQESSRKLYGMLKST